jgi:hypothetical protein
MQGDVNVRMVQFVQEEMAGSIDSSALPFGPSLVGKGRLS